MPTVGSLLSSPCAWQLEDTCYGNCSHSYDKLCLYVLYEQELENEREESTVRIKETETSERIV